MLAVKKLASICFIHKYLMKMLVDKKIWVLHQIIFESVVIYSNLSCGLVIHTTSSCEKKGQPTGHADLLTYEQDYSCSDLIQGCHSLIMSVSETMPDLNCAA